VSETRDGIFGIDLGTTYSVMAYIDDSGKPAVVRDMTCNAETTPSVVYFENGTNVVVGSVAKESAVLYPTQVVALIEREMGSEDWRQTFFGKEYSPPAISAQILGALAKNAAAETGRKVEKVVITVPAYFGMLEKQATRQAGEIAGLDVIELVPEPVAAAFAYGLGDAVAEKTILVYDLGGGTFDVTLIELTASSIEVVVVDGDHKLGGRDWDEVLVTYLAEAAARELADDTLPEDQHFLQDLWDQAEEVKKRLSQADSRAVVLRAGGNSAKVTITRAEFEQLTMHLVDKTMEITKRALTTAEEKSPGMTGKITDVILVGGSSLMPIIRARLKQEFGWDASLTDPHLAVARGAALYAAGAVTRDLIKQSARERQPTGEQEADEDRSAGVAGADGRGPTAPTKEQVEAAVDEVAAKYGIAAEKLGEVAKVTVTNALPKAIGVKVVDTTVPNWEELLDELPPDNPDPRSGPFCIEHIVGPQTPLPYYHDRANPFVAQTLIPRQDTVKVELWEQAGGVPGGSVRENNPLPVSGGDGIITGLASYDLPAGSDIHLFFDVTVEGIVTLRAVEPTSGKEAIVKATVALLSDEEIEQAKRVYSGLTVST
jgi:molecular chaperone DnaK